MIVISSAITVTHQPRGAIEAWQYGGEPFEQWPDWVQSHYQSKMDRVARIAKGNWALRDDEGYLWKWMHPTIFERAYEPIAR